MAKDTVDTRVVRMEFDNSKFEKNIKQTSKSLDKFKKDLDFDGIGDSLDKVKVKFSAFQVAATTVVVNLTNQVLYLGKTMIKSLSVDNISTGWLKFGEKTTSVATMMAQKIRIAGKEITDLAEKTEVVTQQLELLTWFSDETSYSFTDMANNVGKFIAAGQDLDISVKAMEGIATWAAKAGQNSQTASRAMYQLAQAMGKGKIQKIDWMSIQNANMDTEDFRETILATAVAMGELTKEGDKFITKTGKKFTQSQFADFLSEGWFTSDVLVKGLNKYSAAIEQIYEIANREGITASEVMEKYADQLDEFGMAAFKAAQEARTFSDVLNSVKDAVSSKWMTTFERIFGAQEEAVKLWTELANELYDVFAESGNFRNNMLLIWKELGGRNDIFGAHGESNQGAFWNIYDAIVSIRDTIRSSWNIIFPISEMEGENNRAKDIARTLKDVTYRIKELTSRFAASEEVLSRLSKVFQILFNGLKTGLFIIRAIHYILEPIFITLRKLSNTILDKILSLSNGINNILNKIEKSAIKLRKVVWDLIDIINPNKVLNQIFSFIENIYSVISNYRPISRLIDLIKTLFSAFNQGGGTKENLTKIFKGIIASISIIGRALVKLIQALSETVLPILDKILVAVANIIGYSLGVITNVIAMFADIITAIDAALDNNGGLIEVGESIRSFIISLGKSLVDIIPILKSVLSIIASLVELILLIPRLLDAISIRLTGRGIIDNLKLFFETVANTVRNFVKSLKIDSVKGSGTVNSIFNTFIDFFESLLELLKGLVAIGEVVIRAFSAVFRTIGKLLQNVADILMKLLSGNYKELTEAQKSGIKLIAVLAGIAAILYVLYSIFYSLYDAIFPIGSISDALIDAIDSVKWSTLSMAINRVGLAFVEFAVAFAIFSKVDSETARTVVIGITVVGLLFAISNMLKDLGGAASTTTVTINATVQQLKAFSDKYLKMAAMIQAVGNVILEIAVAAYMLDKLDETKNTFSRIIALLIIITGFMVSVLAISSFFNSRAKKGMHDLEIMNQALRAMKVSISGVFLLLAEIAAIALIFDKNQVSTDAINRVLIMFSIVAGSIMALMVIAGAIAILYQKHAGILSKRIILARQQTLKLNEAFKGLIGSILSISVLLLTLTAAIYIINKSLTEVVAVSSGESAPEGSAGGGTGEAAPSSQEIEKKLNLALLRPLLAISVLMAAMTKIIASMYILSSKMKPGDMSNIITLFALMSGTLIAIASSLAMVAEIPSNNLLQSGAAMLAMLGVMLALSSITSKMAIGPGFLMFAAALPLVAVGISQLAKSMLLLQRVKFNSISDGLKKLGIGLGIIVGIGMVAGKTAAINISLLAGAILAIGLAISLISSSLIKVTKSLDTIVSSGNRIESLFTSIGKGFSVFIKYILIGITEAVSETIVIFIKTIGRIIVEIVNIINQAGPILTDAILNLIVYSLKALSERLDVIIAYGNKILLALIMGLLDFIAMAIDPIANKIIEIISLLIQNIIQNLPKILNDITALVVALIDAIADAIVNSAEALAASLGKLISGLIHAIFVTLAPDLDEEFRQKLEDVFVNILTVIAKIVETIALILATIAPLITAIIQAVITILSAIDIVSILALISSIISIIASVLKWLAPLISSILAPVLEIILKILTGIVNVILNPAIQSFMNMLEPWIKGIISVLEGLAVVFNFFGRVLESLKEIGSFLKDGFIAWLTGDEDAMDAAVKKLVDNFRKIWYGAREEFWALGDAWHAKWDKFWTEFGHNFLNWLKNSADTVINFWKNLGMKIGGFFKNISDTCSNFVINLFKKISDTFSNFFINLGIKIKDFFVNISNTIANFFKTIWDKISNFFTNLFDQVKNWGSNLIQGLVDGVKSGWEKFKNGFLSVGEAIKTGWKKLWGINSPSKVFAEYGKFMIQGLSIGLEEEADKEKNKFRKIATDTLRTFEEALFEDEDEYDYVLNIGMDISSVQENSKKVKDLMSSISSESSVASTSYGNNAGKVASYQSLLSKNNNKEETARTSPVDNSVNTTNNTFNITSTDPKEAADEIDKILKKNAFKAKLAKGNI